VTAALVVAGAAFAAALVAIAGWFSAWRSGVAKAAGAEAVAEHNDQRADAAEAVTDQVTATATERQGSLEERIRHDAQARVDAGDPTARNRLLEKLAARAEADRSAGGAAAVPDGAAGGGRTDPARDPKVRGRR
jgi:hypothetical protein